MWHSHKLLQTMIVPIQHKRMSEQILLTVLEQLQVGNKIQMTASVQEPILIGSAAQISGLSSHHQPAVTIVFQHATQVVMTLQ